MLRPRDTREVAEAVVFAGSRPAVLSVRSGGHGFSGRSTNSGGIVIDLSSMHRIDVLDEGTRLVRVEPGAFWGAVATALHPYGWAITSGDHGAVGVGGLATAGGIGLLGREQGLTIDRLRAADVVLADGRRLRASADERPELFWGIRGAGFALGVVTAFEFTAGPVGLLGHARLVHDATDTAEFLQDWAAVAGSAPRDTTAFLTIGQPYGRKVIAQSTILVDSEDPGVIRDRLRPFADLVPSPAQLVGLVDYSDVVSEAGPSSPAYGEPVSRSGLLDRLTPATARAAARLVTLTAHSGYATHVLPGIVLTAVGMGLAFPTGSVAITSDVPPALRGLAGGMFVTAQQLGSAVGLAVLATIAAARTGGTGSPAAGYALSYLVATGIVALTALAVVLLFPRVDDGRS